VPGFGEGKQKKLQLSKTFEYITNVIGPSLMKFIMLINETLPVTVCANFFLFSLANRK